MLINEFMTPTRFWTNVSEGKSIAQMLVFRKLIDLLMEYLISFLKIY